MAGPTSLATVTIDGSGQTGGRMVSVRFSWTNEGAGEDATRVYAYPQSGSFAADAVLIGETDAPGTTLDVAVGDLAALLPEANAPYWITACHVTGGIEDVDKAPVVAHWPITPAGYRLDRIKPIYDLAASQLVQLTGIGDSNTAENEDGHIGGIGRRVMAGSASGIRPAGFGPFPANLVNSTRAGVAAPGIGRTTATPGGLASNPIPRKVASAVTWIDSGETLNGVAGPVSFADLDANFAANGLPVITQRQDDLMFGRDYSAQNNRTDQVVMGYFSRSSTLNSIIVSQVKPNTGPAGSPDSIWDPAERIRFRVLRSEPTPQQDTDFGFSDNRYGIDVRASGEQLGGDVTEAGFVTIRRFNEHFAVPQSFSIGGDLVIDEFAAIGYDDFGAAASPDALELYIRSQGLVNLFWISGQFVDDQGDDVLQGFTLGHLSASGHGTLQTATMFDASGSSYDDALRAYILAAVRPQVAAGQDPAMLVLVHHGVNGAGGGDRVDDLVATILKWRAMWIAEGHDGDRIAFIYHRTHMTVAETQVSGGDPVDDQPARRANNDDINTSVTGVVDDARLAGVRVAGFFTDRKINLTNVLEYADEGVAVGAGGNPSFATHLSPAGYDAAAEELMFEIEAATPGTLAAGNGSVSRRRDRRVLATGGA
ncbi:MAG: hypothetical protein AAGI17_01985 [Planctomycetota bacterium]